MIQQDYSLAIYGSQARSDFDKYSDKDFLIVHAPTFNTNDIIKKYSSHGWSCSTYTYNHLEDMACNGSLFLQHIKQDAKIIRDSGKLGAIINNYRPMSQYSGELKDSERYFDMLRYIEATPKGLYWALDVISVGLRNYCILLLANSGVFEFSHCKIYKHIQVLLSLTANELDLIYRLREYKYSYRNQQATTFPFGYFTELCNLLSSKFHLNIPYTFVESNKFFEKQVSYIQTNDKLVNYQYLRLCESILNSPRCVLDSNKYEMWSNIIKKPSMSAYHFSKHEFINSVFSNFLNETIGQYQKSKKMIIEGVD